MKTERLISILCILSGRERITIQELAERLEVSKRTIFRDLDTLGRAGIPLVSFPGVGGGVAVLDHYKVSTNILTRGDAERLDAALSGLKSIDGDSSVTQLLTKLVPQKEKQPCSENIYVIDLSSWFGDSIVYKKMLALRQAIRECRLIQIEYISRSSRCKRIVEPYKLVFKQSCWYLYAFCRERQAERLFRISRIASWQALEELFNPREVREVKLEQDYGRASLEAPPQKMYEVVLKYRKEDEFTLTNMIDASFFHRSLEAQDEWGEICFPVLKLEQAADLIFRLNGKVCVATPGKLRELVRQRVKEAEKILF